MTMDRTLKVHGGLIRTRSVLTRDERIARMADEGKFDLEKDSPFGLPKTKVRHSRAGMKTKKTAEEAPSSEAAAEDAAAKTPAESDESKSQEK
ncbi:MAG: small basic protein [Planctomycetota bacterium]|nr:small basic protein [Planctomycetota bacterium]